MSSVIAATAQSPRIFDAPSTPVDSAAVAVVRDAIRGAALAAPAVILPDFHHKPNMEMPSSIVVATRETIHPTFTSASVNCGMALIAFEADVPGRAAIEAFFQEVRARYPHPAPILRRDMSRRDVLRATRHGARFAAERFGFDPRGLERMEHGGCIDTDALGGADRLESELPRLSVMLGRLRFGSIGPSNHFVELQRVEEIIEPYAAARLGISLGQLTLQYHAGGGVLAGQIGRLFVRRQKMSRPMALEMAFQRPLYHFASARSLAQVRERLKLYFRNGAAGIQRHEPEGERLMAAIAAAMNYGFAFRAATYASLAAVARRTLGIRAASLLVDSPHNSIYDEEVGGRTAVVHRHNSCRAFPASRMAAGTAFGDVGQAVLLPGTHRTSSYLCVAGNGGDISLFSASHGAGTIVDTFESRGVSRPDPNGATTLAFSYKEADPHEVPQLDDRGVSTALRILSAGDIVRPVARMRPVAVLR